VEIFVILIFIGAIAGIIISVIYGINNHRSIIQRAKQIDPTVSTFAEAQFVLKQNIAQNVGRTKIENGNKIYCKHCGEAIDADSKFCNKCGGEQ